MKLSGGGIECCILKIRTTLLVFSFTTGLKLCGDVERSVDAWENDVGSQLTKNIREKMTWKIYSIKFLYKIVKN